MNFAKRLISAWIGLSSLLGALGMLELAHTSGGKFLMGLLAVPLFLFTASGVVGLVFGDKA